MTEQIQADETSKDERPRTVLRDPRQRKVTTSSDASGINSHVHRAIDESVVPTDYPAALVTMEWWSGSTKNTIAVNEEKLFTMTHLTKGEMVNLAALMTTAQIRGDRVQYLYAVRRALGTLGQDGRGRGTVERIVTAATQKINESVQMHKTKKVLTGGKGEVIEREDEEGYETGGDKEN